MYPDFFLLSLSSLICPSTPTPVLNSCADFHFCLECDERVKNWFWKCLKIKPLQKMNPGKILWIESYIWLGMLCLQEDTITYLDSWCRFVSHFAFWKRCGRMESFLHICAEFHDNFPGFLGFGFCRKLARTKTQQGTDKARKHNQRTEFLCDLIFCMHQHKLRQLCFILYPLFVLLPHNLCQPPPYYPFLHTSPTSKIPP